MNKKILLLAISFTLILSGCGIFNLGSFIIPNDFHFLRAIEPLNTPEKICQYMKDNFACKLHRFYRPSPYELWQIKEGDCNDFSTFVVFVANYHGYETYQILLYFEKPEGHALGVFKENGKYNYSSNWCYIDIFADTFQDIVEDYLIFTTISIQEEFTHYKVFDYEMSVIEEG